MQRGPLVLNRLGMAATPLMPARLEGRGDKLYRIAVIDGATPDLAARCALANVCSPRPPLRSDPTEPFAARTAAPPSSATSHVARHA